MNYGLAFENGQKLADYIYFKYKWVFKVIKYFLILLICIGFIFALRSCLSASALSQSSFTCYSDLYYNDTNSNRLISFVPKNERYLIARVSEYEYICFYGNSLSYSNSVYSATDINFIRYYRTSSSYSSSYSYESGTLSTLTLNSNNYVVTSNVNSSLSSNNFNYDNYNNLSNLFILCSCFFVIFAFTSLWRCLPKNDTL